MGATIERKAIPHVEALAKERTQHNKLRKNDNIIYLHRRDTIVALHTNLFPRQQFKYVIIIDLRATSAHITRAHHE